MFFRNLPTEGEQKHASITRRLLGAALIFCAFGGIARLQAAADASRPAHHLPPDASALKLVRAFDLGLHSAAASLLWLDVRTQLPSLQRGYEYFARGLDIVTSLDPKWSTPYVYTVLVLPFAETYPERFAAALAVGERGLRDADTDWRIPFYIGTIHQLNLEDSAAAAVYFDRTARTPGVPEHARRFTLNYGFFPNRRDKVKAIWQTIYAEARDSETRARAEAYLVHLEIADFLQEGLNAYRARFGSFPERIEELLEKGIVREIPADPFGFEFAIEDGLIAIKRAE